MTTHPLARLIEDASSGRPPSPDGGWHRVPPWRPGVEGVFAFTAHAVLAVGAEVRPTAIWRRSGVDGFGGAHHPRVLLDLAGPDGWIDSLDALLVTRARVGSATSGRSSTAPIWPTTPEPSGRERSATTCGSSAPWTAATHPWRRFRVVSVG